MAANIPDSPTRTDLPARQQGRQQEPIPADPETSPSGAVKAVAPRLTTKSHPAKPSARTVQKSAQNTPSPMARQETGSAHDISPRRRSPHAPLSRAAPRQHFSPSQMRAIRSLAAERHPGAHHPGTTPPPVYRQPASIELPDLETHPVLQRARDEERCRSLPPLQRRRHESHMTRHPRTGAEGRNTGRQSETSDLSGTRRSRSAEPAAREAQKVIPRPMTLTRTQSATQLKQPPEENNVASAQGNANVPFIIPTARLSPFTPYRPKPGHQQWPPHNRKLVEELCLLADPVTARPIRITERFRIYVERVWQNEKSRKLSFTEFLMMGEESPTRPIPSLSLPAPQVEEDRPPKRPKARLSFGLKKSPGREGNAPNQKEKRYYALPSIRPLSDPQPEGEPKTARTPVNVRNVARLGYEMIMAIKHLHLAAGSATEPLSPEMLAENQQRCTDAITACQQQIQDELARAPLFEEFQYRMAALFSRQIGMAVTTSEHTTGIPTFSTMPPFERSEARFYHYDAHELLMTLMGRCATEHLLGFEQQPSDLLPQRVWANLMHIDLQYCEWLLEDPHSSMMEIQEMRASLLYQLLFPGAIFPLLRTNTNPFPRASEDFAIYKELAEIFLQRIEADSLESAKKMMEVLLNSTNRLLPGALRAELFSRQSATLRAEYLQEPVMRSKRRAEWTTEFRKWMGIEQLPEEIRSGLDTVLIEQADNEEFDDVQLLCTKFLVEYLSNRPTPAMTDLTIPEDTLIVNLIHKLYTTRFVLAPID